MDKIKNKVFQNDPGVGTPRSGCMGPGDGIGLGGPGCIGPMDRADRCLTITDPMPSSQLCSSAFMFTSSASIHSEGYVDQVGKDQVTGGTAVPCLLPHLIWMGFCCGGHSYGSHFSFNLVG